MNLTFCVNKLMRPQIREVLYFISLVYFSTHSLHSSSDSYKKLRVNAVCPQTNIENIPLLSFPIHFDRLMDDLTELLKLKTMY